MSFKENYDKVFLGSGIVLGLIGIGVGAWFYSNIDDKYTVNDTIRTKNVDVPGIAQADSLEKATTADYEIQRPMVGAHPFDVFVGPTLYLPKGTTTPQDIFESGATVHAPIPNAWFIDNGLEHVLRMSDALTQDSDNDGFSNLEEFNLKTHPNDAASHPLLILKLALNGVKNRGYDVTFYSDDPPNYSFRATAVNGQELWRQTVPVEGKLGKKPADENRFVLKKVETRDFENKAIGIVEKELVATIEDLNPAKAGKTYDLRRGNRYPVRIIDSTASFTIVAGSQPGTDFSVEVGLNFKIPGDDKTEYKLLSVDNQSGEATVTATVDGQERTWKVKK